MALALQDLKGRQGLKVEQVLKGHQDLRLLVRKVQQGRLDLLSQGHKATLGRPAQLDPKAPQEIRAHVQLRRWKET